MVQVLSSSVNNANNTLLKDFPHLMHVGNANMKKILSTNVSTLDSCSVCYDIAHGQEVLPIAGVRYDLNRTFPHSHNKFQYISGPMSEGPWSEKPCCNCTNCNEEKCPCRSKQSDRRHFHQDTGALLIDDAPRALYTCSRSCKSKCCYSKAINGIGHVLRLLKTKHKGWAVQTLQSIPKGTYVCDYVGESVSFDFERQEASVNGEHQMTFVVSVNKFGTNHRFGIDGHSKGNIARFFNHSCEPNMSMVLLCEPHMPIGTNPRVAMFTTRDVDAFEEMTWMYNKRPSGSIECKCGAQSCRKVL
jgi:SET domain-containing protein